MNRPKYCCQKGSAAPLILKAIKAATYKPGSWVEIPYIYKKMNYKRQPSKNIQRMTRYYRDKFPKFKFAGNHTSGRISLKYVGNK